MQTVPLVEAQGRPAVLVDQIEKTAERVVITRDGAPVAVVLSVDDLAALEGTLAGLDSPDATRRANEADEAVAAGIGALRQDGEPLGATRCRASFVPPHGGHAGAQLCARVPPVRVSRLPRVAG